MNKEAFNFGGLAKATKGFGEGVGKQLAGGLQVGAATAAITGVGMAVQEGYNALTKARDFNQMMKSPFNQDLKEHHERDPNAFNAAFTSLRAVNPSMSKDPMTAGMYLRRMMTFDPSSAGGVLIEALQHREHTPHPLHESFSKGIQHGVGHVFSEQLRDRGDLERDSRRSKHEKEMAQYQHGLRADLESWKAVGLQASKDQDRSKDHANSKDLATFQHGLRTSPEEIGRQEDMERFKQITLPIEAHKLNITGRGKGSQKPQLSRLRSRP